LKKILLFIPILFLIPIILAQPSIELKHIGYGETPQEVHVILWNTGNTSLTKIEIYADNEQKETMDVSLPPNKKIEYVFYLSPGEHLLEAKTIQGAHDSFRITVSDFEPTSAPNKDEKPINSFLTEKNTEIIIGMFIIFFVIVIWVLKRRPRLKLD